MTKIRKTTDQNSLISNFYEKTSQLQNHHQKSPVELYIEIYIHTRYYLSTFPTERIYIINIQKTAGQNNPINTSYENSSQLQNHHQKLPVKTSHRNLLTHQKSHKYMTIIQNFTQNYLGALQHNTSPKDKNNAKFSNTLFFVNRKTTKTIATVETNNRFEIYAKNRFRILLSQLKVIPPVNGRNFRNSTILEPIFIVNTSKIYLNLRKILQVLQFSAKELRNK